MESCCKSYVPIQLCLNGNAAFLLLLLLSITVRDFRWSGNEQHPLANLLVFLIIIDKTIF